MVDEAKYFYGIGASEVYLLKVSTLKLSHPSACPVFILAAFPYYNPLSPGGRGRGEGERFIG
jgi:hypothetical protein